MRKNCRNSKKCIFTNLCMCPNTPCNKFMYLFFSFLFQGTIYILYNSFSDNGRVHVLGLMGKQCWWYPRQGQDLIGFCLSLSFMIYPSMMLPKWRWAPFNKPDFGIRWRRPAYTSKTDVYLFSENYQRLMI